MTTGTVGSETVRFEHAIWSATLHCTSARHRLWMSPSSASAQTSAQYHIIDLVVRMSRLLLHGRGPVVFSIILLSAVVTAAALSAAFRICSLEISLLLSITPRYLIDCVVRTVAAPTLKGHVMIMCFFVSSTMWVFAAASSSPSSSIQGCTRCITWFSYSWVASAFLVVVTAAISSAYPTRNVSSGISMQRIPSYPVVYIYRVPVWSSGPPLTLVASVSGYCMCHTLESGPQDNLRIFGGDTIGI